MKWKTKDNVTWRWNSITSLIKRCRPLSISKSVSAYDQSSALFISCLVSGHSCLRPSKTQPHSSFSCYYYKARTNFIPVPLYIIVGNSSNNKIRMICVICTMYVSNTVWRTKSYDIEWLKWRGSLWFDSFRKWWVGMCFL